MGSDLSALDAPSLRPADRERGIAELRDGAARFGALLRSIDDLDVPGGGEWTVREVAAHVVAMLECYRDLVEGGRSPIRDWSQMPPWTAAKLAEVAARSREDLESSLRAGVERFSSAVLAGAPDARAFWHADMCVPVSSLVATVAGEFWVHGFDVARRHRRPWTIPAPAAHSIFRGVLPVVPMAFDPTAAGDRRARVDIRLRGEGTRAVFDIADGAVRIGPVEPGRGSDCYVAGDPVALLLVVYGRTGAWHPALRGRILAWGRKPWLGLVFPTLFRSP
ncbi:MAG: maleylpyruvate isomerase family mycothiol-dependent enzyme [Sporichthyaceae bacterium]